MELPMLFDRYLTKQASIEEYIDSIKFLTEILERYYNQKAIILIDEYDVPIESAYLNNCYDDVMSFIRMFFNASLKTNDNVWFSVLTGVMRVSGESLFSDLNNVEIYSVIDDNYKEYFGFTESETKALLNYYSLEMDDNVKKMYDGYSFCGLEIYNPWSILRYADRRILKPYWVNTSSNRLLKELIFRTSNEIRDIIEDLLKGSDFEFVYDEKITYLSLDNNYRNNILNFLLICGYLTVSTYRKEQVNRNDDELEYVYIPEKVRIPNDEVRGLYLDILHELLIEKYNVTDTWILLFRDGILNNDKVKMEENLNNILMSISYYDNNEYFYHGFMTALLYYFLSNKEYIVKSNRESGDGRYDVMIERIDRTLGIVLEFKHSNSIEELEMDAVKGLNQIKDKKYYQDLILDKVETIYTYGISFYEKSCIVK